MLLEAHCSLLRFPAAVTAAAGALRLPLLTSCMRAGLECAGGGRW